MHVHVRTCSFEIVNTRASLSFASQILDADLFTYSKFGIGHDENMSLCILDKLIVVFQLLSVQSIIRNSVAASCWTLLTSVSQFTR